MKTEYANKLCANCRMHDAVNSRCLMTGKYITGASSMTSSCVLWAPNQVIADEIAEEKRMREFKNRSEGYNKRRKEQEAAISKRERMLDAAAEFIQKMRSGN